ncbi:DUF202 domain-containing protein [Cellulomonas marina]|uniref:Putative membrane protein n=1 Tax=Cellulomonas marina TaxID=988821 RepID=A0A1I1ALY1_9CELL|nr:DUF202 domain-containing protein [Cellulomonas marina]GIG30456.1 hypothetical protein Cma02nite_30560 [Cellulomonas marina]SFB39014.1 putative membrane protein [Cellulomonas marina]
MTGDEGAQPGRGGAVLDDGLQPERTALAWRRTGLAVTVGGLVALRVLPPALGGWGLAAGLGGTAAGLLLALLGTRRTRAVESALRLRPSGALPAAGALLAALSAVVSVGAAVCLVAVVVLERGR